MVDVTELETDALAANDAFYAAFAARDMAALEAVWASGDELTCIHPGWNVLVGREAVLESWRAILANPAQARPVAGGARVTLVGEAAIVICRELVGGSPLAATNVFALEDGRWRLVHHQAGPVAQFDS